MSVKVMAMSGNDVFWYETWPRTKAGLPRIHRMVRRQRREWWVGRGFEARNKK